MDCFLQWTPACFRSWLQMFLSVLFPPSLTILLVWHWFSPHDSDLIALDSDPCLPDSSLLFRTKLELSLLLSFNKTKLSILLLLDPPSLDCHITHWPNMDPAEESPIRSAMELGYQPCWAVMSRSLLISSLRVAELSDQFKELIVSTQSRQSFSLCWLA